MSQFNFQPKDHDYASEHMFPIRFTEQFAEKLRTLGGTFLTKLYQNAEHGFFYDLTRHCQKVAFADILKFLSEVAKNA